MGAGDLSVQAETWSDSKKYLWPLGLLVPLLPFVGGGLALSTGLVAFWFIGPLFVHVCIPVLEFIVGEDLSNPPEKAVRALNEDPFYRAVVIAWIPLQFLGMFWVAWLIGSGVIGAWAMLGATWTLGIVNGIAFNTAHELGHKRSKLDRWLSRITLAPTGYGHFYVEHNRGHHVRVATPEDPASARIGESFWVFLPRTVVGSVRSAWDIEKRRLAQGGRGAWSLHNEILQAWSMTVLFYGALIVAFGFMMIPFALFIMVYAITLFEVVNYIEHYGLLRQKTESGRYERCRPEHSWNSNTLVTNLILYQLQRHSDHHANPTRKYQALRHFEEAPQLPSGYASMVTLAYFPPLWRMVMDPRVVRHYNGDLSQANLQPGKEEGLKQRFPVPAVR